MFITDTAESPDVDVEKAEVIADYDAKSSDELTVRVGETVEITDKEKDSTGWWKVRQDSVRVTNIMQVIIVMLYCCIAPG